MSNTLLLDQSCMPLKVIPWTKAVTLFYTGKIDIVQNYEDKVIRATSLTMKMPSVARLKKAFKRPKKPVKFSRQHIYARDRYTCQYCCKGFGAKELTYDHVIPKSRGGKTAWNNIVSACHPCNRKKGDRTPSEAGLVLRKAPRQPNWVPAVTIAMKHNHPKAWKHFLWV